MHKTFEYRLYPILLVYSPRVIGKRKFPIDPGSKMAQRERLKAAIRINQQYLLGTLPEKTNFNRNFACPVFSEVRYI